MNYSRVIQFQRNTYLTPLPLSNPILPSRRTRRINYSRVEPVFEPVPAVLAARKKKECICMRTHRHNVTPSRRFSAPPRLFIVYSVGTGITARLCTHAHIYMCTR